MGWVFAVLVLISSAGLCNGGTTNYGVVNSASSVGMPMELFPPPPGYNAPEQVHITQGDLEGRAMIVSWVTQSEPGTNRVTYWKAVHGKPHPNHPHGTHHVKHGVKRAHSHVKTYSYINYTSGYIHHSTIKNLEYNTKYYYQLGSGDAKRRFSFTTPPEVGPDVPYIFGIIGDLGQTYDSNQTLEHYNSNQKGQAVLFVGDLSYADDYPLGDNSRWDSWARFVEKNAAYQPWIWTAGDHELDYLPYNGESKTFKPYTQRYHVPYKASNSTSPLWYSIKRASAHIIVLSSYSAYGMYTPQYTWLQEEFGRVNREETPWLIVLVHCPWYNSYNYHFMEGETMRVMFESWFVQNKVDLVLSGHVHAYERSERISNIAYDISNGRCTPALNQSAPVYITIGDGGNIEGHADKFVEPQPSYSAYRESSFGHGMLDIKNRTHAFFSWHRNQDNESVIADSLWLHNRHFLPTEESSSVTIID